MSDDEHGHEQGSEEEDIVLQRRIDRRLEANAKSDYPWLRRIVGFAIIAAAFFYGWQMLNRQGVEVVKQREQEVANKTIAPETAGPSATPAAVNPSKNGMTASIATELADLPPAKLDGSTLNTISECTKGANAFRLLDFNKKAIADGDATLESVFKPVLKAQSGIAKRTVQLQNVRIRTKKGEELRLHAVPKTQSGQLYLKLFRVADDGLPEEAEFPDAIKNLRDQPLSDHAVTEFLQISETPGRAIEVERHESWSFTEKAGAQVIWSNDQIFQLQVFMRSKFMSCSHGVRAGSASMNCKCIVRKAE